VRPDAAARASIEGLQGGPAFLLLRLRRSIISISSGLIALFQPHRADPPKTGLLINRDLRASGQDG
jgi:hypothetical protein